MSRCDTDIKDIKQMSRCDIDIDDETLNGRSRCDIDIKDLKEMSRDTDIKDIKEMRCCDTNIDDETLNGSRYRDIATLHFIWEGAYTFYVTEYDEHGSEIGGYNDPMTQQRRSRILVTVGNDPGESPLLVQDFTQQIHGQRVELHREFYNDEPSRVNDMKLVGNWRRILRSSHETCVPYVLSRSTVVVKLVCIMWNVRSGKQLLSVTENDVQTKTKPSTPPWSFESLSDSDIKMKNEVKAEQEMEEPVHNDFHPLMYEDDLLQKEDPVNYQQDPYHGEDEAEENAELFDEQDHLLEHVPFLKETVVIVDGDAPLLAVDALVVPPVIVLDEQLERPNKRRKLNPA
ncbi:hypothetical protein Tco_0352059 [Tanacetum coccineum]